MTDLLEKPLASPISTRRHGDVLIILSNNPPVNALSTAVRKGLVDAIAEALEDSGKRVAELMAAERQFSANASHQLRSPLTAIAISLELIADSTDPLARREATEALTQVAGLDDRINELLKLARTGRVAARARTDVAGLVARHVQSVSPQFHRAGRTLTFVASQVVEADVTPTAVTQSVEILRVHDVAAHVAAYRGWSHALAG